MISIHIINKIDDKHIIAVLLKVNLAPNVVVINTIFMTEPRDFCSYFIKIGWKQISPLILILFPARNI